MKIAAQKITQAGNGKTRIIVKNFKTYKEKNDFILKNDGWCESRETAGTYAFVGGQWRNIKTIPVDMLNHI